MVVHLKHQYSKNFFWFQPCILHTIQPFVERLVLSGRPNPCGAKIIR